MKLLIELDESLVPGGMSERVYKALESSIAGIKRTAEAVLTGQHVTRNQIARLAGVASTSVKAAIDAGKTPFDVAFPPPVAKVKKIALTEDQIAAIKAAGIEI